MTGESANTIHECALVCKKTLGCTHFVWLVNERFCFKKTGFVTKEDAIDRQGSQFFQCGHLEKQIIPGKYSFKKCQSILKNSNPNHILILDKSN